MNPYDAMLVSEGDPLRLTGLPESSDGLELGKDYLALMIYNHGNGNIQFGIIDGSANRRVLHARYFSISISRLLPAGVCPGSL